MSTNLDLDAEREVDLRSAWEGDGLSLPAALANEFALGRATHDSGESQEGARRFAAGAGRHGQF